MLEAADERLARRTPTLAELRERYPTTQMVVCSKNCANDCYWGVIGETGNEQKFHATSEVAVLAQMAAWLKENLRMTLEESE